MCPTPSPDVLVCHYTSHNNDTRQDVPYIVSLVWLIVTRT